MSMARFVGATAREAMRRVRLALGDDAMIVANRQVDGGVEIVATVEAGGTASADSSAGYVPSFRTAASEQSASSLPASGLPAVDPPVSKQSDSGSPASSPLAVAPSPSAPTPPSFGMAMALARQYRADVLRPTADAVTDARRPVTSAAVPMPVAPTPKSTPPTPTREGATSLPSVSPARSDLAPPMPVAGALPDALDTPIRTPAFGARLRQSPVGLAVYRALLAAGFSAALARALAMRAPAGASRDDALTWAAGQVASRLPVGVAESALMAMGGVYALVGPTGVGKTTTTAKLAARCVMAHGAERVAMLTTDGYRVGAHEQLRIYGRILGVPVLSASDGPSLQQALAELQGRHIVLIDTIGMSQRDRSVAEQAAMLCAAGRPVRRLLLLNAASHGDTLDEVAHAYRDPGVGLTGCILTKIDESARLGAALDVAIRHRLPIHYVSDGQKVPESFAQPEARALVDRALEAGGRTLFLPTEEDFTAPWAVPDETACEPAGGSVEDADGAPQPGVGAIDTDTDTCVGMPMRASAGAQVSVRPDGELSRGAGPIVDTLGGNRSSSAASVPAPSPAVAAVRLALRHEQLRAAVAGARADAAPSELASLLETLARDRAFMLARQVWREYRAGTADASALADMLLSDVRAHAADVCERYLLVLHGRQGAQAPAAGKRVLAGSALCSDRGEMLAAPARHLITAHGVVASFDSMHAEPLASASQAWAARVAWLVDTVRPQPVMHVFDGFSMSLGQTMYARGEPWLARCHASQRVLWRETRVTASALAAQLGYVPAGEAWHAGRRCARWVASADVGLDSRGRPPAWLSAGTMRFVAVRLIADDGVELARHTGLAVAEPDHADALMLGRWLEQAAAARDAESWMQTAIDVVAGDGAAGPDFARHMLAGAQLGLSAWRLTHTPGFAARLLGFAQPGPNASQRTRRAGIDQMVRILATFDLMDGGA